MTKCQETPQTRKSDHRIKLLFILFYPHNLSYFTYQTKSSNLVNIHQIYIKTNNKKTLHFEQEWLCL